MGKGRRFDVEAELKRELKKQRKAFIKKFGREPGPNDPVFLDPAAVAPQPIDAKVLDNAMLDALRTTGVPPQIVYAYKKTGRLLTESGREQQPPEVVAEWDAAIDEYFLLEGEEHEA